MNTGRLGAQGLYNISTPVSKANAQPGDLIFFVGTYDTPGVSPVSYTHLINTDQVITQERNTLSKNYQSINLEGMDRMDERNRYEEIIKENLDYDILCQDLKFDKYRFREIMDIMLDAVCSTAPVSYTHLDVYKRQPHCETGTEGDNERLKNRDSLIDESHRFSSLI